MEDSPWCRVSEGGGQSCSVSSSFPVSPWWRASQVERKPSTQPYSDPLNPFPYGQFTQRKHFLKRTPGVGVFSSLEVCTLQVFAAFIILPPATALSFLDLPPLIFPHSETLPVCLFLSSLPLNSAQDTMSSGIHVTGQSSGVIFSWLCELRRGNSS